MMEPVGSRPTPATPVPDPAVLTAGRLRFGFEAGVATITLDHPQRLNAQIPATWEALLHIRSTLPAETRVVVVRGAGGAFSAGLDLSVFDVSAPSVFREVATAPIRIADDLIARFQAGFSWLSDPDFLSVAVVQGHAVGAGFQLALAADLIVVADDVQFRMAEVTHGLVPDLGGTRRLVDAVGARRALELCVTGRVVDAEEAVRIGLANRRVPLAELDAEVDRLVAALIAHDRDTVRAVTGLIESATRLDAVDQLAAERTAQIHRFRALLPRP